jgi:hypothetical protein
MVVVTADNCPNNTADSIDWLYDKSRSDLFGGISDDTYANRITIVELPTQSEFHKPTFVNDALRLVHQANPNAIVLLMDADTLVGEYMSRLDLPDNGFMFVQSAPGVRDLTGILICQVEHLMKCGGLDERMRGWGAEDLDLRLRLFNLGLKPHFLHPSSLSAIAHDDSVRVEHYSEKDHVVSLLRNTDLMCENYKRDTGRELIDDQKDTDISTILGYDAGLIGNGGETE